jgi:hypothetical protein
LAVSPPKGERQSLPPVKENPGDLSNWMDVSDMEQEAPRPFELRNAYCTMLLVHNGKSGAVMPAPTTENLKGKGLYSELQLVVNGDHTISFFTPSDELTPQNTWGLVATGTGLSMQRLTKQDLDSRNNFRDQFKFRLRLQQKPRGGPNYANLTFAIRVDPV